VDTNNEHLAPKGYSVVSWIQLALTSACSVLAGSGFWAYLQHKSSNNRGTAALLMGLAYDRITTLGIHYIERGWVTRDELEELDKYFFRPYKALGGNGVAERIMMQVNTLPLSSHSRYAEIFRNQERVIPNVRVVSPGQQEAAPQ
jgi:hypothetical protein